MLASNDNKHILIVDRDVGAVEPLRQRLSESGFAVLAISDGAAALAAVAERPPHLIIVDWNMQGFAVLEFISSVRAARASQALRLIVLTALAGEQDIVSGLDWGADDYIAKPFSLREVVARVSALLRQHPIENDSAVLACDDLVLDSSSNRVTTRGRLLNVRGIEYRLLHFLMSNQGRTFNRTHLLARVWGDDSDVDERTVDVNVQRLRKLIVEAGYEGYLQTVRGFGYRFCAPSMARVE